MNPLTPITAPKTPKAPRRSTVAGKADLTAALDALRRLCHSIPADTASDAGLLGRLGTVLNKDLVNEKLTDFGIDNSTFGNELYYAISWGLRGEYMEKPALIKQCMTLVTPFVKALIGDEVPTTEKLLLIRLAAECTHGVLRGELNQDELRAAKAFAKTGEVTIEMVNKNYRVFLTSKRNVAVA